MAIYPNGKPPNLRFQWEIAAFDLPVPERLLTQEDYLEWNSYVQALPPARLLDKLGQAVDGFLELALPEKDFRTMPEEKRLTMFSKWRAASNAAVELNRRLQYARGPGREEFRNDLDETLFFIADFLKGADCRTTKCWIERRMQCQRLDDKALSAFLQDMLDTRAETPQPWGASPFGIP